MVPSQISPVKPVFGVITKLAAILTGSKYHLTESTQNKAFLSQNDNEIVYYMNWSWLLICDMVPSQIFPVKPVFGVITKLAAILTGSKYHLTESTQNKAFLSQNDNEIVYYMNWSWLLICDMVPSQIFPVKPVFGVITKLAAILTGSKYHLTESTRNLAC